MPKVYVTNKGAHDFSDAHRFGRLIFCTEGNLPRYNIGQMCREIMEAMADSDHSDYILLTSLSTLNAIACSFFAHKHGRVNLLLFHPRDGKGGTGRYIERSVVFDTTKVRRGK